jgi:hypothetical protein
LLAAAVAAVRCRILLITAAVAAVVVRIINVGLLAHQENL